MIFKESESERRKNTPVIELPITEEMVTLRCTLQNVKPPQSVLSAENTDMHRASEGLLAPPSPRRRRRRVHWSECHRETEYMLR